MNRGKRVFIAAGAAVIGEVFLADDVSVFFNAVLRGDINYIRIGACTNVQDGAIFHVSNEHSVEVGCGVTIGHGAIIHGCTISDNVTVGMGAIIMDGALIGEDSLVAAGSLVPPGRVYEKGVLIKGSPAVAVRELTVKEIEANRHMAKKYIKVKDNYLAGKTVMKVS